MLDKLRKGAGSWIAKIFIALLVLSFAVWGIADIFGGYGAQTVAQIGERKISSEEYRLAYQNELQRLSYRFGRRVTSEQARLLGLENQVLSRLVSTAAIDNHAQALGLGISDDAIAKRIQANSAFQGSDGRFSRRSFEEGLAQVGLSEQGYVQDQRNAIVRGQVSGALISNLAVPATLLNSYNSFRNETRKIDFFELPQDSIESIPEPDESALRTYYDDHKRAFTAPQYRKLDLLVVTPDELKTTIEISDEDIKQEYESQIDTYTTPERRRIAQITFPDRAAADKAHAALKSGTSFAEVAKLGGQTESDIDLGQKTKRQLADAKIAEAAFALAKDAFSEPVEGTFSTVIVRVTEIEPGSMRGLEDVKDKIKDKLARDRANNEILDLNDAIEDERAGGSTLEEISSKLNLKRFLIDAVGRSGKGRDGKDVADLPASSQLLRTAFESDVGVENDPIEVTGGGFAWVDVVDIIPEKLKPFDTVKEDAKKQYIASKRSEALQSKARALADKARSGVELSKLAEELGGSFKSVGPVKRGGQGEGLSSAAVAQAFTLPDGGLGTAQSADGKSRVVFKVVDVTKPSALEKTERDRVSNEITRQLSDELLVQYAGALRDRFGVTVNDTVFRRTIGADVR